MSDFLSSRCHDAVERDRSDLGTSPIAIITYTKPIGIFSGAFHEFDRCQQWVCTCAFQREYGYARSIHLTIILTIKVIYRYRSQAREFYVFLCCRLAQQPIDLWFSLVSISPYTYWSISLFLEILASIFSSVPSLTRSSSTAIPSGGSREDVLR